MSRALLVVALCALAGCTGSDRPPAAVAAAWSIPAADLAGMEPQVRAALERSLAALAADKASAEAWGDLATLYDAHSLFEPAEQCYRRAVELAPGDFRWTYLLAIVRDIRGATPEETRPLFAAAAALDPQYAPVHVRLGDALARHGLNDDARASLERALELEPDLAVAHRLLGQVRLAQGALDEAGGHLERALELEPGDLTAHTMLAQLRLRQGRAEEAAALEARSAGLARINALEDVVYDRWVFERSRASSRMLDRARIRMRDGDHARAAADLEALVELRPGTASLHRLAAEAYAAQGLVEQAARHLERAIALDPADRRSREQLAALRGSGG